MWPEFCPNDSDLRVSWTWTFKVRLPWEKTNAKGTSLLDLLFIQNRSKDQRKCSLLRPLSFSVNASLRVSWTRASYYHTRFHLVDKLQGIANNWVNCIEHSNELSSTFFEKCIPTNVTIECGGNSRYQLWLRVNSHWEKANMKGNYYLY